MYLYSHRPKLRVALSRQEEVLREVLQDLMQWHLGHSSGGSRCTQVGSLIIKV
jgi:hypothetical protein